MKKTLRRILLINKNPRELGIATEALAADYSLTVVTNSDEAVKLVKDLKANAILIDWESFASEKDVQTFVDACKSVGGDPCFIVLAPKCGAAEKAQSVGLNYFLPKPFDHLTVSVTVNACIG
jgi:CheY-like chemotaxis protein